MMGTGTNTLVSATLELMICIIDGPLMQTSGAAFLVNWRWKLEDIHQCTTATAVNASGVVQQRDDGNMPSDVTYAVSSLIIWLTGIILVFSVCPTDKLL